MTCGDNEEMVAQAKKRMVASRIVRVCLPNFVSPLRRTGIFRKLLSEAADPAHRMAIAFPNSFRAIISRGWQIHVAVKDLALLIAA
jgi:hypothetical protein